MVAVFGLIGEGVMVAFFVTARFTFGFYAVRIISLVVSKVVLIVLLSETMILHARLSIANRHLQRERANRLTSAEAVVAAIAHEIRQPLTGISLLATAGQQHLDRASPDTGTANKLFGQIKDAAFRANEVFDGFLSLFREGRQDRQAVDVNTLTQEATHLLRKDLDDHNVIARTKLASDLPVVEGHSGQLREVILNLIQNSIEAMASTTNRPRILSITTSRLGAGAVFISLQDTGPGIEPQKLASIFDPFVTTKAKGTGLGLAICKMIVDQHRGKLSAASDGTDGTRFEITLPTRIAEPPPRRLLGNKASPSDLR
jgi:signal transduction histidine kinase